MASIDGSESKFLASSINRFVNWFMLLDDVFKGMVFSIGVLVVVLTTALILIKVALMGADEETGTSERKERIIKARKAAAEAEAKGRPPSTAKSTSVATTSEEPQDEHEHLLSRTIIPIKSNDEYEEEFEISVMEEDDDEE
ncbi:LAMI_0H00210g1_1 [Lachancea mirantina]|uniref:LAMI_0H00210g1_1 n=1 Tax=Lachancea mirantina TaxID=1230905 RepID=A0A1G4KDI7_9SACH|nr:LAMI_0H00210g1_1 [Lachancea mirantina]